MANNAVDTLNMLLRGEISAAETYRMACEKMTNSQHLRILQDNLASHEQRAQRLRECVRRNGGTPAEGSGAWGAFARLWHGGANVLGEGPAIAALEEGEDQGLRDYRNQKKLQDLPPDELQVVHDELLPEQERTHRALSELKAVANA